MGILRDGWQSQEEKTKEMSKDTLTSFLGLGLSWGTFSDNPSRQVLILLPY